MQTLAENILDVTLLEPRQKHPTIFARFDELESGETLTIHNDHDPKPLYYQLLGERGNIFVWEYIEQGPQWWIVSITKRIAGDSDETLGQIAAKDLHKAQIFKKYGLDFCCGGKKTLKQACAEKGLDAIKIEQELQQADNVQVSRPLPYTDWSLDFLADYIVNTHHSYVVKTLPDLRVYAHKVMKVHGDHYPELIRIHELVKAINAELTSHLAKEEKVLFPYIKALVAAGKNTQPLQAEQFGTVQNPINMMEMEHEAVGEYLVEIRELSNNFKLPEDACASYNLLYGILEEFEDDLHLHIHLENNILFPKALEIEKKLNS
jgi:regulator of cell morphogenesis and NO signaling